MKFEEIYQNFVYLQQAPREDCFIFKGRDPHPCWNCGDPTIWIEGDFQAYLCSPECVKQKYIEFLKVISSEVTRT